MEKINTYLKLDEVLAQVLDEIPEGKTSQRAFVGGAASQAIGGKGIERHARERPWLEQPIIVIQRAVGQAFALGQAMKKVQEAERMEGANAMHELEGAIVYLAAWHAVNEIIWGIQDDDHPGVEDPGLMAETAHFADVLRIIHQTMFCANGEQERAACRRAIAAVAELGARIRVAEIEE